jgi:phospholipase/carboxylesterase
VKVLGAREQPELLVVLLHGVGSRAEELVPVAERWVKVLPRAAFLLPNGFHRFDGDERLYQWFSRIGLTDETRVARVRQASSEVSTWVDGELARRGLRRDRLVVAGYSQGGMVALHLAVHRRPPPLAAVSLSGRYVDAAPTEGWRHPHPPAVLLVHGEEDDVIPFRRLDEAHRDLAARGIPAETLRVPGLGHAIAPASVDRAAAFLGRVHL